METYRNDRFRQTAENKTFMFLAVSVDFPGMDYESAALTIELRARAGSSADFLIVSGAALIAPPRRPRLSRREPPRRAISQPQP
jgi:hypothetical protein